MPTVWLLLAMAIISAGDSTVGTWKMNATRSTSSGGTQPKSLTVRIDTHPKGSVFTLERVEPDGRITAASTVLYYDAVPRDFQDFECSGTQASRRTDPRTVEIIRNCGPGAWTRFICQTTTKQNELILEISERHADGRQFVRRLVLEKTKEKP